MILLAPGPMLSGTGRYWGWGSSFPWAPFELLREKQRIVISLNCFFLFYASHMGEPSQFWMESPAQREIFALSMRVATIL